MRIASENHVSEVVLDSADTILSPSLSRGGHLSRDHDVNVFGQRSDVFPAAQGGPLLHTVAGKAVGFAAARTSSKRTPNGSSPTRSASARCSTKGTPAEYGGTDRHLLLVDLREPYPDLTTTEAENALSDVGSIGNENAVPGQPRSPMVTSGTRVGTFRARDSDLVEAEMETGTERIVDVLDAPDDDDAIAERVSSRVDDPARSYRSTGSIVPPVRLGRLLTPRGGRFEPHSEPTARATVTTTAGTISRRKDQRSPARST